MQVFSDKKVKKVEGSVKMSKEYTEKIMDNNI